MTTTLAKLLHPPPFIQISSMTFKLDYAKVKKGSLRC